MMRHFPKIRSKKGCPILLFLFRNVLELLDSAFRLEKEITAIRIGKKKIKTILFADKIIV